MTVQEQAFRAYYASLTDAELFKIAGNRRSFIDVAQQALSLEISRRNLAIPEPLQPTPKQAHEARGKSADH